MAWRAITESDLLQKFSSDELEGIRSAGLAQGQADPVAGHIAQLTKFVTGYLRANPANKLGAVGTLPESLILPAIDYLVVEVSSRVAGLLIDLNDTRRKAREDAIRLFRDVAAGSFLVEQPDDTTDIASGGAATVVRTPTNPLTGDSMAGL